MAIPALMRYWMDGAGLRYCNKCHTVVSRPLMNTKRSNEMAVITQEKMDKAIAKAVAAETRRCAQAAKAVEIPSGGPVGALKKLQRDIVAAIKE
jgi:hypothetical protein